MNEAEVVQSLRKDLDLFKVKVAVKISTPQIRVFLQRPAGQVVDYDVVTRLIRVNLRSLQDRDATLSGLRVLTVSGRVEGDPGDEHEVTSNLESSEASDREGETIFFDRSATPPPSPEPELDTEAQTLIARPRQARPVQLTSSPVPTPAAKPGSLPAKPADQMPSRSSLPLSWILGGVGGFVVIVLIIFLVTRG